jgi:hypothetical protein
MRVTKRQLRCMNSRWIFVQQIAQVGSRPSRIGYGKHQLRLFYRNGFRQVARLVHVAAAADGYVVCE